MESVTTENAKLFDLLCRTLIDPELAQALQNDLRGTLAKHEISNEQEIAVFGLMFNLMSQRRKEEQILQQNQQLLTQNNQLLQAQLHPTSQESQTQLLQEQKDTMAVITKLKYGLETTLDQIDQAYRSTMLMYQITFYFGLLLMVVATVVALKGRDPLLPAVFGSLGTISILSFFLARPQEKLQSSRASLAQLQAALYQWFILSVNLTSAMATNIGKEKLEEIEKISSFLQQNTEKTLEMIEKYCEFSERDNQKPPEKEDGMYVASASVELRRRAENGTVSKEQQQGILSNQDKEAS